MRTTILIAFALVACATEAPPPERPDAPVAPADAAGGVDVAPEAEAPPDAPVAPDVQATPDVQASDVAPLPPPDAGARDASLKVSSDTAASDVTASEVFMPVVTCFNSMGNCDGISANGCETSLQTSPVHCGACGNACPAHVLCSTGVCRGCFDGWSDCDGIAVNGCEVHTSTSLANCGRCGRACEAPYRVCSGGACGV